MQSEALKPCPFCGGNNLRFRISDIEGWIAHVECTDCDDMLGPMSEWKHDEKEDAEKDATAVWNKRAAIEAALSAAERELPYHCDVCTVAGHGDAPCSPLCDRSAPSVAVKALEWNPFRADTPFGYYHIDDQTDRSSEELNGRPPFLLSGSRLDLTRHSTLEAAKAAAQADYEARIRSALSAQVQDVADMPQSPWPASDWAIARIKELEGQAVPEGWKLVPVEPTEEMEKAGRKEAADCDDTYGSSLFSAAEIYRAMLAAAPAKQEGGE